MPENYPKYLDILNLIVEINYIKTLRNDPRLFYRKSAQN